MASASTLRSLMEIRVVLVIGSFMASASTLRFLIGIRVVLVIERHGSSAFGLLGHLALGLGLKPDLCVRIACVLCEDC